MSLITCGDCGSRVSDALNACPKCGRLFTAEAKAAATRGERIGNRIKWGTIAGAGLLFAVCQAAERTPDSPTTATGTSTSTASTPTASAGAGPEIVARALCKED